MSKRFYGLKKDASKEALNEPFYGIPFPKEKPFERG